MRDSGGAPLATGRGPGIPRLGMREVRASELAARAGWRLVGGDSAIRALDYIDAPDEIAPYQLTFANSAALLNRAVTRGIAACVTTAAIAADAPDGISLLVPGEAPADAFFSLFADLAAAGYWRTLDAERGRDVIIAPTAVIEANVILGDRCRIMANTVIHANTRVGADVVIQPNSVIGGDGFEVRRIHGRRRVVDHVGGVWIGDGVEIGSSVCVDRGVFGEFTSIGEETKIDNLVHVAHRVVIGRRCAVVACAEISGSVTLEDEVWIGPNSSINQGLVLGRASFVGTGAVVTKPVAAHSLVYGSPARHGGWRCHCRAKLIIEGDEAICASCGATFRLIGGQQLVVRA